MPLKLYNTLSGTKDPFDLPKDHIVTMYTCGPTVYNYAHIGNLRAYVFADVLRRTLEYNGYKVRHVMNITDIGHLTSDADDGDDKMVKALRREGKQMTLAGLKEVAEKYTTAFVDDLKALNIELPHEMPKASEHIADDVELIQRLAEKGIAYTTSDGVYFDVSKFPQYGTRGGFALGELREGARVAINEEKHTPRDFSLWKSSKSDIGWESPWGRGFPGWHIECSAMSRKFLGQPFDIHTGGIDHIPTHHQNEIAQSEAAYGVPLANFWMHNEFVNMGEARMAKSAENFVTLQTLTGSGISPLAYRLFLLEAGYRTPLKFSEELVRQVQNATLYPLYKTLGQLPAGGNIDETYRARFLEALGDDLNTAKAFSLVYAILGDAEHLSPEDKRATILDFDKVFGLDIENQSKILTSQTESVPAEIQAFATEREEARKAKDFKKSDTLRAEIETAGYEVMDTDSGAIVRKKL